MRATTYSSGDLCRPASQSACRVGNLTWVGEVGPIFLQGKESIFMDLEVFFSLKPVENFKQYRISVVNLLHCLNLCFNRVIDYQTESSILPSKAIFMCFTIASDTMQCYYPYMK